jgi:hypothetical protein
MEGAQSTRGLMKEWVRYFVFVLAITWTFAGVADDLQKAEKQMRMMTAMSRDDTARSIVSRTFSDVFKMERRRLIAERKSLGLNYGSLFLAHELVASGVDMQQIVELLGTRENMLQVAIALHANWKRVAVDARQMNKHINNNIYNHFMYAEKDKERDMLDGYNPDSDLVPADKDAKAEEIRLAAADYVFWRNLAGSKSQANGSSVAGNDHHRDPIATAPVTGQTLNRAGEGSPR